MALWLYLLFVILLSINIRQIYDAAFDLIRRINFLMAAQIVDENATSVKMTGLALAIFAVSISCLFLSAMTVGLRLVLRVQDKVVGLDDGLILAGLVCDRVPLNDIPELASPDTMLIIF